MLGVPTHPTVNSTWYGVMSTKDAQKKQPHPKQYILEYFVAAAVQHATALENLVDKNFRLEV